MIPPDENGDSALEWQGKDGRMETFPVRGRGSKRLRSRKLSEKCEVARPVENLPGFQCYFTTLFPEKRGKSRKTAENSGKFLTLRHKPEWIEKKVTISPFTGGKRGGKIPSVQWGRASSRKEGSPSSALTSGRAKGRSREAIAPMGPVFPPWKERQFQPPPGAVEKNQEA